MPHRRPVNEYERESPALYRCKRITDVEKTHCRLRSCKQIAVGVEFRRVHKHFREVVTCMYCGSMAAQPATSLCIAALVLKELAQ
jgi:hypothetical protein